MKNVFTLLLFAFCLLNSGNLVAQNTIEVNNAASEITAKLKKEIKFKSGQEYKIYDAYVAYTKSINTLNNTNSSTSLAEEKKKVYAKLRKTIQTILSEEQYQVFEIIEKRNTN